MDALENQEVAIELVLLILLAAGAYVGWNIGANDTANCIGTTVGAVLLPFRRAVLLAAIFAILGAMLQGQHVMKTIGKQITPLDVRGAFVAQTASAVGMHLFALWGIPVSSSSAIVGAVVGVGLVKGARTISKKNADHHTGRMGADPLSGGLYRIYSLQTAELCFRIVCKCTCKKRFR